MTFPLNNKHRGGDFIRSLKATWLNTVATVLNTITGVGIKWVKTANGVGWQTVVDVDGVTIIIDPITAKVRIAAGGITATHIATSVAGSGLTGGGGSALSVQCDNTTVEINTDTLRVKDSGITSAKIATSAVGSGLSGGGGTAIHIPAGGVDSVHLAAAVAGAGLTGGAGSALAVNPDGSTLEISGDTVRVKANGLNSTHMTSGYHSGSIDLSSSTKTLTFVNGLLTSVA